MGGLCALPYGDVDWDRRQAVILGKGDRQAVVRFSSRALQAIRRYVDARQGLAAANGRLSNLPVFARHDPPAQGRHLPLSPRGVQYILAQTVAAVLGAEAAGTITPHTFRHYFVTRVVRQHGAAIGRSLARHELISTTQRYVHLTDRELDAAYSRVFEKEATEAVG